VRFGANLEVSLLPQHYDRNRWGMELRPIAAYEDEHWLWRSTPSSISRSRVPTTTGAMFQPAAMAVFKLIQFASVGVEYYGNLGPFSGFASGREQEHYIYEVFNLLAVSHIELNAGSARDSPLEATRSP